MKKKNSQKRVLSLEKLQIAKLNNLNIILGGIEGTKTQSCDDPDTDTWEG